MNKLLNILLCPQGRLQANFPWSGRTAAKNYAVSVWRFFKYSFAVPLLFLGTVFALTLFPTVFWAFLTPESERKVLSIAAAVGALLPLMLTLWRRWRYARPLPAVSRMFTTSIIFGLLAMNLLVLSVQLLLPVFPQLMEWLQNVMSTGDGDINITFLMGMSTISFVMGFSAQMLYINSCLKQDNLSLVETMALHLRNRRGSNWFFTAINVIWPVLVTYGLVYCIGETVVHFLGQPHQSTVEMAKKATGGNFVLFALMAAVGAPLFEELVFRGFLYQVIRSVLRLPVPALELATQPTADARFLALRKLWVRADNWVRRVSYPPTAWIQTQLRRAPDFAALFVSSALFAVMHMQFHPTTLVLLFVLGCVHAELYRRTGSLWCSILLHALNNGLDVYHIAVGG